MCSINRDEKDKNYFLVSFLLSFYFFRLAVIVLQNGHLISINVTNVKQNLFAKQRQLRRGLLRRVHQWQTKGLGWRQERVSIFKISIICIKKKVLTQWKVSFYLGTVFSCTWNKILLRKPKVCFASSTISFLQKSLKVQNHIELGGCLFGFLFIVFLHDSLLIWF